VALKWTQADDDVTAVTVTETGLTRPKVDDIPDPDERWRRLGQNPDGTLIDPTHLQ